MTNVAKIYHKIFAFDRNYVRKNLPLTVGAEVISSISVLAVSIVAANLLSSETYGTYKYLISLGALATTFSYSGAYSICTKAVAQGYTGTIYPLIKKHLTWGLISVFLCFSIALYYFLNGNNVFAASLVVIGLLLPPTQSLRLFMNYLNGLEDFKNLSIFSGLLSIVPAAMIAVTMYLFESPLLLIGVNFFVTFVMSGVLFSIAIHIHQPDKSKTDPEAIAESTHMSVMTYMGSISQQIDQVVTFQLLGPTTLALYNFALAPAKQISGLTSTVSALIAPRMAKHSYHAIQHSMPQKILLLGSVSLFIYVVYFISAPYIFDFVFSKYTEAIPYTRALGLIILFTPTLLLQQALVSHSKIKELYIIKTIVPIFKICSVTVLTLLFGLPGLVSAFVATNAFRFVLFFYYFQCNK